jgi:hypothetical protein
MSSRIDLTNFNGTPFELYENNNIQNNKTKNMTGTMSKNSLSDIFFSQSNIDLLQDYIIKGVFDTSGTKIVKQSEDELSIIMRSIYLQHGKNLDYNIQEQINTLNEHILKYCIPNINSSIKQYNGYIKDITKEQDIMDMPQSVNTKGDKTLMPRYFI